MTKPYPLATLRHPDITAHTMVAAMALDLAQEVYEELASRSNEFYKVNQDRDDFIRQCAPTLRAEARTALGMMLSDPDLATSWKDKIFEALVLDAALPKTGTSIVKQDKTYTGRWH
jgi:hypothetical protein